jgi:hypothetical protein
MTKEEELQIGYKAYLSNKESNCRDPSDCAKQHANEHCNKVYKNNTGAREMCNLGVEVAIEQSPEGCAKIRKGTKNGK